MFFKDSTNKFLEEVFATYPIQDYTSWSSDPAFAVFQKLVPSIRNSTGFYQAMDIWGHHVIICESYYAAKGNSKKGAPTWKLFFHAGDKTHSSISPYVFRPDAATENPALSAAMKDYYRSFVVNLDPNKAVTGLPVSPRKISFPQYTSCKEPQFTILKIEEQTSTVEADPATGNKCNVFQNNVNIAKN